MASAALLVSLAGAPGAWAGDWLYWRGPAGNGTSAETGLPVNLGLDGAELRWSYAVSGGCAPVVHGDRLYAFGYHGAGPELQEVIVCLNAVNGNKLWEHRYSDFLSDIIYNRYGIGSPAVDGETGNVFFHTSAGLLLAFDRDGKKLWERSLMEEFARLTFPNGRTGGPVVDGDLVILHAITANWGSNGPARDRFYAFDKHNGDLVWFSTPGVGPKDSSFSPMLFDELEDGRRVFYSGTGCGNVVCVDARTGEALWRFQASHGGVNSGVVLHGDDTLILIHGKENIDKSTTGRMVALKKPRRIPAGAELPMVLGAGDEKWRNEHMEAFSSSPVIQGDRVYSTVKTGELVAVDANTGKDAWRLKLAPDQLHASPLWAEGRLYVPMFFGDTGKVFVVKPGDTSAEILSEVDLGAPCLAAPSVAHGRLYVHSKEKLFCFGSKGRAGPSPRPAPAIARTGPAASLQIVPAEFALRSGRQQSFKAYSIDAAGRRVGDVSDARWEKFIPPTARVRAEVDAALDARTGTLTAAADAKLSAGALKATSGSLSGTTRGRILQSLPYAEDFEGFELDQSTAGGTAFAYPPLPWLGARMRYQVLDMDGNKVLANTLGRVLFQRSMNFIGAPEMSNYTAEADVMTDGNRRVKSTIGLVNQRYIIALVGNSKKLEVVSNHDRLKVSVPFNIDAKVWYRLVTRVDVAADGSGVIRAKAWKKGEPEPADWTIEVPHENAHTNGSPGIFAFSPQSQKRVFLDNLKITPNR